MPTSRRSAPPPRPARVRRGNAQDHERMRGELLAAANALFADGGLEAVTMRAIAARIGVSSMTPYRYFADKAELLSGMWESVIHELCTAMKAALARVRGGRARQRVAIDAFLAYWEHHPDHYRLVYMTQPTTRSGEDSGLTRAPVYAEILALVDRVTQGLADEIGATMAHAKVAGDMRFAMQLGYLNAVLVNRRYPWGDRQALRETMIAQIVAAVERCLLDGPGDAAAARARSPKARAEAAITCRIARSTTSVRPRHSYDRRMTSSSTFGRWRGREIAARYRDASLILVVAVALLAGTAIWLVIQERLQVWATARRNQQDVATAMQSSISALLAQSVFSLKGIRSDLAARPADSADDTLGVLREAQRFDPLSAFLGVATKREVVFVDAHGRPGRGLERAELPPPAPAAGDDAIRLGALLRLPGDAAWYLPVTLPAPGRAGEDGVLFALVPADRLLGAASSLKVLPGSFVTLFTTDGTRLIRKLIAEDRLQPNGPRVPDAVLAIVAAAPEGSFTRTSTVDGRPTVFGYSTSAGLPLVVTTGVPESALQDEWLAQAAAPFAVLVAGMVAVVVFAIRLSGALRAQADYVRAQEYLASHDQLTGLPNRYAFIRHVDRLIARTPEGTGFCVLLLDVNRFKDVNDTLGHAAGDTVLEILGGRLETLLDGASSCVARLGGDEIAICASHLDGTRPQAEAEFCDAVHAALAAPLVAGGVELALTASIGIAAYPAHARTSAELLRCADIAMYRAKADLATHCRYSELMDHFTADALALRVDFAKAIRDDSLALVYQPKLRLRDGALVGVEALSRWTHPVRGPIPPMSFLPLAETTELIHPFTDLVLRNAVAQIARWLAQGHAVPVAVNISANNLLDPAFAAKVRDCLAQAAVPARLLELEVTESAVMRYPDVMLKRLHELRDIGVRMSIDDFGTGYASLSYLKRLPVNTLKIDKVFITEVDSDPADRRIVRSSILLAHGFGMNVVAEGVESQAVADLLAEDGCDCAQGFHFARPLTREQIEAQWLGRLARDEAAAVS